MARRRHNPLRIVGGRDVRPGEFPYVVRFEEQYKMTSRNHIDGGTIGWSHVCTASVLSSKVSLTAAHCFFTLNEKFYEGDTLIEKTAVIRYGSAPGRPTKNDRFSEVLSFLRPSGRVFGNHLMDQDLALMTTQPILMPQYARVSAVDHHTLYGQRVSILGYGGTNYSGGLASTLKLNMSLQVLDGMWSKCEWRKYPYACVVEACGLLTAVCGGDSGGPVVHASGVVGITSRGPLKAVCSESKEDPNDHYIDDTMPLSSNIDWIADTIAKNSKL